jgi:hypothetical protein
MPAKSNIPGGSGEQAIGQVKRQVKANWNTIKTQSAFEALSDAEQKEILRRFMVFVLRRELGATLSD